MIGSIATLSLATFGSGERPCSTKWSCPPGFRMRRISASAASTSGIEQSVQVESTASAEAFGRSMRSPSQTRVVHAAWLASMRSAAMPTERVERLDGVDRVDVGGIERNVQARSEPDLHDRAAARSAHTRERISWFSSDLIAAFMRWGSTRER